MLRYKLYDQSGALTFTSGLSGLQLDNDLATLLASPADEAPKVTLYQSSSETPLELRLPGASACTQRRATRHARRLSRPKRTGREQAAVLSRYFNLMAAITLLLLSAGIALPGAFAWMRERQRRKAEEQLHYLEGHDDLTGLANRKAFGESLAEAMERMHRERTHIAVLCLDIDKFKEINEAADHSGGDQVLRDIGAASKAPCAKAI